MALTIEQQQLYTKIKEYYNYKNPEIEELEQKEIDPNKYFFKNGSPFEDLELVKKTVDRQILRKNQNKPAVILIDGALGSGKTSLTIHLMDYINIKHNLQIVDLTGISPQYTMGAKDFIKEYQLILQENYPTMTYDEASEFDRKGQLSKFVRTLSRLFDLIRRHPMVIILILPSIKVLPDDLFIKKIPRVLYHLKERDHSARATMYSLYRMFYIRDGFKKTVIPEQAYKRGNYKTRIKDLTPKRAQQLREITNKGKEKIWMGETKSLNGLNTYEDIAEKVRMSTIWVKKKILELKIEPELIDKKRKYFKEETIQRVKQYIK